MIQNETRLKVADNTGAREILCIRVKGGSRRRYARVGDIITAIGGEPVAGRVPVGVPDRHRDHLVGEPAAVGVLGRPAVTLERELVHVGPGDTNNPRGTRIFGPVARELRERNFMKIVSLAPEVL